jgi:hypothetical protein
MYASKSCLTYSLFNEVFNSSEFVASIEKMRVKSELERMWKRADVAYFKTLSLHLSGNIKVQHEKS